MPIQERSTMRPRHSRPARPFRPDLLNLERLQMLDGSQGAGLALLPSPAGMAERLLSGSPIAPSPTAAVPRT